MFSIGCISNKRSIAGSGFNETDMPALVTAASLNLLHGLACTATRCRRYNGINQLYTVNQVFNVSRQLVCAADTQQSTVIDEQTLNWRIHRLHT